MPFKFHVVEAEVKEEGDEQDPEFHEGYRQSTMNDLLLEVDLLTTRPQYDLEKYLKSLRSHLQKELATRFQRQKGILLWVSIKVKYLNPFKPQTEERPGYLHTGKKAFINPNEVDIKLDEMLDIIRARNINFSRNESGLTLDEILKARVKFAKYNPLYA